MKSPANPSVCVSDGVISHLRAGWSLFPFVGQCAHWWVEDRDIPPAISHEAGVRRAYASLCGIQANTTGKTPALEEGNWPRCRSCQRRLTESNQR